MDATILFRGSIREKDELAVARNYFRVVETRCTCDNTMVIGRYSCLPFYSELEKDLVYHGSSLINSYDQHLWVANFDYYEDLLDFTFESWDDRTYPLSGYDGPVVVKGRTNSRKHNWNTLMFANNRREAVEVAIRLRQDDLIGPQGLVYRKYVPLVTYEMGLNGLAFTNEWRCFFLGDRLIAHGYYWTEAEDVDTPRLSKEGMTFALNIAKIASKYVNFFVLDIGEKAEGGWVLVEVNDAQCSGLSMIEPDSFYRNLAGVINGR
jgi:hypothetical protein